MPERSRTVGLSLFQIFIIAIPSLGNRSSGIGRRGSEQFPGESNRDFAHLRLLDEWQRLDVNSRSRGIFGKVTRLEIR